MTVLSLAPGLFVTGTDTGIGKTAVSCALLRAGCRAGLRWIPYKPVETGDAAPSDAHSLWDAAGQPGQPGHVTAATFPLPAAPAVAAAAAGVQLEIADLLDGARRRRAAGDGLLVEGAGGLLVPYAGAITGADLAAALSLPVLVVARAALGTINHTALTVREIERRHLPLAGVILCETAPGSHDRALDHANQIAAVTGVRPLGTLPFVAGTDPDRLADALTAAIGIASLAGLLQIPAGRLSV